jgi:patatin-like phospholipase/acyl hydrolase
MAMEKDRFRILSVDGGGMRGLIPALVIRELEARLQQRAGPEARVSDYFHMFAGTSTGGLVALALTTPDPDRPQRPLVSANDLSKFYTEDGKGIFHRTFVQRLKTLNGLIGPKYGLGPLQEAVERRLGQATLDQALRELVVCAYDMTSRQPYFFKRWRARETLKRNETIVEAALATSAAPTYFPSHEVAGFALVDGGVFAANPTVAAIVEALNRGKDKPAKLAPEELLVVSVGTGEHERGFSQSQVSGWGQLGWVLPKDHEPPILSTVLGGASDGVDYWAHTLLNRPQHPPAPEEIGRGPAYFRWQVKLTNSIPMDDPDQAAPGAALPAAAERLIETRSDEIDQLVERLLEFEPLEYDPPV